MSAHPHPESLHAQRVPRSEPRPGPAAADAAPVAALRKLTLLCIALPMVLFASVGTYRYWQIRDETEVRLDRALRIAREHALKVFDSADTTVARVLDAVGNDEPAMLREREPELHEKLRNMSQTRPQLQSIWFWGPDGAPLASDRFRQVPSTLDVSSRSYFEWHRRNGGGLYFSEPLLGKATGTPFFDVSRGRYRPDGSFSGVVSVSLFPDYFSTFHGAIAADEPGLAITMFRRDGTVFSRFPQLPNALPKMGESSVVLQAIRAGQNAARLRGRSSLDGHYRLLAFSQVGDYPVYLGTGIEGRQIWWRWWNEMGWFLAFSVLPTAGLILMLRVALRRTRQSLETAARLQEETVARHSVEDALLQAQKLEALGRLTGGVAHDFNNALMVISSNLFLHRRKNTTLVGNHVDAIGRAVESATQLTRQLLAFSRRQALLPTRVDLREKLPELRPLLEPVLGAQISLSVEVAADTACILIDAAEFELSLLNLAINARDAMGRQGTFRLIARNAIAAELPALLSGPTVVVEAADSGEGIAPEVLGKVFEPFFTTKAVGEGTGLGLSQVYGLCQRAGGLATIDSTLGKGTTLRLFFPATEFAAQTPAAPAAMRHPELGLRILLVEDNDEVAAALIPVLDEMGCAVRRFDRAQPAFSWLGQQARLPDVLLSDVVMPGEVDGVALAQRVRTAYPTLRVVLMTGYAEQMEAIMNLGFEVLPKPCAPDVLADALARTP